MRRIIFKPYRWKRRQLVKFMQTIDTQISRKKFEIELANFLSVEEIQRRQGIFLLKKEFPNLFFSFVAHKLKPAPIIFAVRINFDNYDLEPLSVRFIDPFSFVESENLPVPMTRKISNPNGTTSYQNLAFQEHNCKPMICLPGIREYHLHPAHTGDAWLLHRGKDGEGSLGFILDKLYEYGVSSIISYQINVVARVPNVQVYADENVIPE